MADVIEVLCAGTLIVHVDESAWCSEPGCATRWEGDASTAAKRHPVVVPCSTYFTQGCPACQDIRVWTTSRPVEAPQPDISEATLLSTTAEN